MHLITFSGLRFALYGLNATSLSPLSPCAFSLTPLNPLILTAHVTQPASPRQPSIPIALVASALRCFLPLGYRLSFVPLSNSSYRKLVPDLSLSSLHRL